MKAENEHRIEMAKALEANANLLSPAKGGNISRGGNQPKSLRGGGGAIRSFFQSDLNRSKSTDVFEKDISTSGESNKVAASITPSDSPAPRTVFSRILGQK
jgi:hypothetical protein